MAPRGWWHRWPPDPSVSPGWLAFRMETAYGDKGARPSPEDVVAFLDWCRTSRRRRLDAVASGLMARFVPGRQKG